MERPEEPSAQNPGSGIMKMWDGRFSKPSARLMEEFNSSLPVDRRLIGVDIDASIAWAKGLHKAKILTVKEYKAIEAGLRKIIVEYKSGFIRFHESDEDIHMAVERLLVEKIGAVGEKLHTGRSRNDQVITDVRLYVMRRIAGIRAQIIKLQKALLYRADSDIKIIAPAFTHLQQAQPILLSHYWLSLVFALEREKERFSHAAQCADLMSLGSGAVAGSGFPVDRDLIAKSLGFSRISENSIDGVSSRDFVLETISSCVSTAVLLSRHAEDLIVWSSREFGFVELDDAWSTGSSMMPQKKNPDSLELIRGKAARFIANYTRLATMLKGVGLAYFKDLQEDKEPLFDSLRQLDIICDVFSSVVLTLSVRAEAIKRDLDPLLLATDLADYLVSKGMPFRQAHKVVGKIVGECIRKKVSFAELSVQDLKRHSDLFGKDSLKVFKWENAIAHRAIEGGTGLASVKRQIQKAKKLVE
jgi:argininosuccinate lyase